MKNNIKKYATCRAAATAILKISTKVLIGLSKLLFLRKQQRLLSEHSVSRAPKELHYNGIFVFRKDVKEQNAWHIELVVKQKSMFRFMLITVSERVCAK